VLRRGRDQVQVGVDPATAVVVERLAEEAALALLHLDGTTTRAEILRLAPELAAVLDELAGRGLLDDDPETHSPLGAQRRRRMGADLASLALTHRDSVSAHSVLARRARATVVVRGNDRAAAHVALGLAAAGVGSVAVAGPDRTTDLTDLTPVGPWEPHVSWRGEVGDAVRRQGAHPTTLSMRTKRPVLTIVCHAADTDLPWTDPELADDLLSDGVPHLAVSVAGDAARVGPLVVPGRTPCLWCLDCRSRDLDAAWPALADQIRMRHPVAAAHSGPVAAVAGAFAVIQSLAVVDGLDLADAPVTVGGVVDFRGPDHLGRRVAVARHPRCGCGWSGSTDTMVG
jgi:hypothetical protein